MVNTWSRQILRCSYVPSVLHRTIKSKIVLKNVEHPEIEICKICINDSNWRNITIIRPHHEQEEEQSILKSLSQVLRKRAIRRNQRLHLNLYTESQTLMMDLTL